MKREDHELLAETGADATILGRSLEPGAALA
jgi:hypothetical protein